MRISKYIFNLRFYNKGMSLTKISKVILSSFEDKRYYVDGLHSYEYGHHEIRKNSSDNKGDQSPPEGTEKRKRIPDETMDLHQKKKKLGVIYHIVILYLKKLFLL